MRRFLAIGLLCIIGVVSCSKKSGDHGRSFGSVGEMLASSLDLNKVIVGKPGSIVSVLAPIEITFNQAVIPQHLVGAVLDGSPFEITPSIPGTAKWLSQSALRFTPEKPLAPGVTYNVELRGKKAFGSQSNVNDFSFSFKTAEQEVVEFNGDFEPEPSGLNLVRFKGVIVFAQAVMAKSVQSDLSCAIKGRSIKITVDTVLGDAAKVKVVSEPIKRGATLQVATFTLPSRYSAENTKWSIDMMLPEVNAFKVLSHSDMSDPEAQQSAYGFRFSDPLRTGADLSGYITIEPPVQFTPAVDKKTLLLKGNFLIGQEYTVKIARGFPSVFGTKLAADYTATVSLANSKPQVEWLSQGVYLPSDNNFKLQFKSINVAAVRCKVTQIFENNLGFFVQTNILHSQKSTNSNEGDEGEYSYGGSDFSDLNRVGKEIYDSALSLTTDRNKWIRSELDLSRVFSGKRNAGFIVTLSFDKSELCGRCTSDRNDLKEGDLFYEGDNYYGNPCQGGYYYRNGTRSKLLIASDIGLTLKSAADGLHVFANNVIAASPASGLELGLYSYQNQLLEKQTTDGSGHALFSPKETGFYVRGEDKSGLAIMRLDHPAWEFSSVDITGSDEGGNGVSMFIYADRGVHRPGDTVHLSAIVRTDRKTPPADQPLRLKVYNPKGQVVKEMSQPCGDNGHVYFAIPTGLSDPTGSWRAELSLAGETVSKELKIETVKPNRLKVAIDVPDTVAKGSDQISGTVSSRYLFGTPASGLRAVMRADLSYASLSLPAWSEFTFSHPLRSFQGRSVEVFDRTLDEKGTLSFNYTVTDLKAAQELVLARLHCDVYEKGGSFTPNAKQALLVPYRSYTGIKNPFGWSGAQTGQTYRLPIIVCDVNGKPVPGHRLTLAWYVNKRYWWYDYDSRTKPDFRSLASTYKVGEFSLVSGEKPVTQTLDVEDVGQNFIEVTDNESGHVCGMFFYASQWGSSPVQQDQKERPMLPIASDKNVYFMGDKIQLSCETPKKGMVIVTIEQGRKILRQEVRTVTPGRTTFTFDVTPEMTPNCYAVVSLLQPHDQSANDVPLRIYGVKPLAVEDFSTRLQLGMDAPQEIKPNEKFSVTVTSKAPQAATYTLAIVDEGLLDLTAFATPDPWKYFFAKLRLGVESRDNLDEILGVLYPNMDRRFSIGGDMEQRAKRAGESKVQRFKPVVLFAKPMTIKAGQTQTNSFTMPNYVGSVRIMLVGTAKNSYGSIEKTVPVRQPLMILATVPRVARPGDRFSVPVSVFATDNSVGTVSLKVAASGPLAVVGSSNTDCKFAGPGEKEVAFTLEATKQIGAGKIVVTATSGNNRTSDETDLPIVSANPFYIKATDTTVLAGTPVTFTPKKFGLEPTNKARFSFTRMPDIQLEKRYKDLIEYPYGCIEQTTSAVFPQLYLGSLLDLTAVEKRMITDNVNGGIERLANFIVGGGFSYWPLDGHYSGGVSKWGTLYASHFLIEARAAGYNVPDDLYNHAMSGLNNEAKNVNRDDHRYQCYRLFLLALAGKPNQGAMNLVMENYLNELNPLARKLLAAAFYRAGQKDAAARVEKTMVTEIDRYREMDGTWGSTLRDQAFIAYLSFLTNDMATASRLAAKVAKTYSPGYWYSTQEVAMSILAIANIYGKSSITGGAVPFTVAIKGGKSERLLLKTYQTSYDANALWGKEVTITTEGNNPLFVTLFEEGIPVDNIIKTVQKGIELTRNFYDEDGRPITIESIKQGKQFWIRYRVRSLTEEALSQLALSSLLPSGWELINQRLEGNDLPEWVRNFNPGEGTYMDLRDDRVNWFFDLNYNGEANFVVKCNPTFGGTYVLPPVTVEPMYSPEYYARIEGGTVTVK
jgi:alpha-2-macroglobulin